jgi:hypothetical protein
MPYLGFVLGAYSEKFSGGAWAWIGVVFAASALAVLTAVHRYWAWRLEEEARVITNWAAR